MIATTPVKSRYDAHEPEFRIISESGPFRNLGEQLQAVAAYGGRGLMRRIDSRLIQVYKRAAAAGGSEQLPGDGGFLVQPEFTRAIVQRMYLTGQIYRRCQEIPITRNAVKFPQFDEQSRANGSRLGGVQVFWENEAQALVGTKPALALSELNAKKVAGLLQVTDELSMDSDALATWATYAFSQELTFALEHCIISGTGAGQPLGITNSAAAIPITAETGQGSATVVSANIQKMLAAFWAASYESGNALWLYNQGLLTQLSALTTKVGAAGSESKLWQWAVAPGLPNMLAGAPAIMSEHCAAPGAAGDLLLVDPSRYVIAMRERLRGEVSIHVMFESDQSVFRFIMRVDGQPIDAAPVTPLNGTTKTSPFVVLGARS
jgi:HK97 family phage major capsid protein